MYWQNKRTPESLQWERGGETVTRPKVCLPHLFYLSETQPEEAASHCFLTFQICPFQMDHPNWLLDLTQLPYSMGIICVSHGPCVFVGFSGGSVMKNPAANAGDPCSILGLGRSSGGGNDNPFQYSCLENPLDRGAWRAIVHGITKELDRTQWLNNNNNDQKCLKAAAAAKSLQSYLTLCNPLDGSPPGSPIPGILQARTLEWVAIAFSNAWKWKVKVKSLSRVQLLATRGTEACQAPLSMGFSKQKSIGVGCHCLLQFKCYLFLKE